MPGLDILNVARAGRSPMNYALFMPTFQAAFQPALAIVQLDDADLNDLEDPVVNAAAYDEFHLSGSAAAWARERSAGGRFGFVRALAKRSALLTLLRSRVQLLVGQERARLGRKLGLLHAAPSEDLVALPPSAHSEAMLNSLVGEIVRVNPHTILVYVPHFYYFDAVPRVAYPMREAWYHTLAARRGLPLVDPAERMLAEFRRTGEPLHGFLNTHPAEGHLNARGHRIVGELLAGVIRSQTAPGGPWGGASPASTSRAARRP